MVALGILAVGVLGATSGQILAMKLSSTSRHAVIAMQLAEEQMETLQSMPAADVKALGTANDANNPLDPDANDGVEMAFTRRWTVTPDDIETGVITLAVEVDWTNGLGQGRTTRLESLKADL
jgi:Tfp pilus assembly protein PilV